mmetsp:Transcript_15671/g.37187  ORF Transcript_15671/g.37187 Transcript_15671/m.37187 type:complete len:223 (-) Transcript_15671:2-670(-)
MIRRQNSCPNRLPAKDTCSAYLECFPAPNFLTSRTISNSMRSSLSWLNPSRLQLSKITFRASVLTRTNWTISCTVSARRFRLALMAAACSDGAGAVSREFPLRLISLIGSVEVLVGMSPLIPPILPTALTVFTKRSSGMSSPDMSNTPVVRHWSNSRMHFSAVSLVPQVFIKLTSSRISSSGISLTWGRSSAAPLVGTMPSTGIRATNAATPQAGWHATGMA